MKCANCGATIPEGWLYCPICGMEIQIVPDYNPWDDVLTGEVRRSVRNTTRPITRNKVNGHHGTGSAKNENSAKSSNKNIQNKRPDILNEQRRRKKARRKRLAKMRRQRRLIISAFLILVIVVMGTILYQNSYAGQISKGNKALTFSDYAKAEKYFTKAVKKNRKKAEAYKGLSKIYIEKKDLESAENVFLSAIAIQPSNAELYRSVIEFYLETKQPEKVSEVLNDCEYENVLESLKEYVTPKPEFDLSEGTYDEVQEVALTSKGNKIYYTTDGSDPDVYSQKYDAPILIYKEGKTQIKAISVNKNKIPSVIASKTYTIELPIEEAPSVSPSTGQYKKPCQIEIIVPEGYTAYYTMNDTDPSDPASGATKYEGPIPMPEGQTIFNAVLKKNDADKYTPVTKRNYVYEPAEE